MRNKYKAQAKGNILFPSSSLFLFRTPPYYKRMNTFLWIRPTPPPPTPGEDMRIFVVVSSESERLRVRFFFWSDGERRMEKKKK